ncbi:MAG: glutathione S-transferase [Rhodoferax sp.]|nr:glutathione S-transferase [Rhodoferax sp.]
MQLVGMLDSPYVRRVAVSLHLLGLPFEHRPVSVFSAFAQFQQINPVVKAPTLVVGDGTVLMDSTLILQYAERVAGKSLVPADLATAGRDLRLIGLALAACEKTVQIVYEHELRPSEKRHAPWLARVDGQLAAAYAELERGIGLIAHQANTDAITQAGVSSAVAWQFTQMLLPGRVPLAAHPALRAFSERAERLPAFLAAPPR